MNAQAHSGERKSPVLAFVFNFFLPGFGTLYALDSIRWGAINWAAAAGVYWLTLNYLWPTVTYPHEPYVVILGGTINGFIAALLARRKRAELENATRARLAALNYQNYFAYPDEGANWQTRQSN